MNFTEFIERVMTYEGVLKYFLNIPVPLQNQKVFSEIPHRIRLFFIILDVKFLSDFIKFLMLMFFLYMNVLSSKT